MTEKIFHGFESLMAELCEAIEMRLDDAVEEKGLGEVCPACVAKELLEENATALMSDIYKVGKDDPKLLLSAITRTLMNTTAQQEVLVKMLHDAFYVFEDDLKDNE